MVALVDQDLYAAGLNLSPALSPSECCCFCVFPLLQVLLFLQEEKEESSPEAQVKEETGENLKHCGHCRVLNESNYTTPSSHPPPLKDPSLISGPTTPLHPFPPSPCLLPPRALSFLVLSAPPAAAELKECRRPTDSTRDSLILLSTKNKQTVNKSTLHYNREGGGGGGLR